MLFDSAATQGVPLDGYGIRYQYGLFRQYFEDGFQKETADDWQRFGDPWSVRREDAVTVQFGGRPCAPCLTTRLSSATE